MKVILEFDPYEDREELEAALAGGKHKQQVDEIWDQLFRPRHKHGYSDSRMNELLGIFREEEELTEAQKSCNLLLDILEQRYRDVKHDE